MADKSIQIEEDLEFQQREWAFQRVGTWAISAIIVAAALGFFGAGGPFSRARVSAPQAGASIEYERFARVGAPARLQIRFSPPATEAPPREVRINRSYFDSIRIERITPEPQEIAVESQRVKLRFPADALRPGGGVILDYQPLNAGNQAIEVQVDEAAPISFRQFAYF